MKILNIFLGVTALSLSFPIFAENSVDRKEAASALNRFIDRSECFVISATPEKPIIIRRTRAAPKGYLDYIVESQPLLTKERLENSLPENAEYSDGRKIISREEFEKAGSDKGVIFMYSLTPAGMERFDRTCGGFRFVTAKVDRLIGITPVTTTGNDKTPVAYVRLEMKFSSESPEDLALWQKAWRKQQAGEFVLTLKKTSHWEVSAIEPVLQ